MNIQGAHHPARKIDGSPQQHLSPVDGHGAARPLPVLHPAAEFLEECLLRGQLRCAGVLLPRHQAVASAWGGIPNGPAMALEKRKRRAPGMLGALSEQRGRNAQNFSRLRPGQLHDFARNECGPVLTVQTLEHAQRAGDLDFLDQQRPLGLSRTRLADALDDRLAELFEAAPLPFARTLSQIRNVVEGDAPRSGSQVAAEIELGKPRDNADEDFLRGVLGVLPVAEHAERQAEDIRLERFDQMLQSRAVSIQGPPGGFLESRLGLACALPVHVPVLSNCAERPAVLSAPGRHSYGRG